MGKAQKESVKKEIIFTCLGFVLGILGAIIIQHISDYKEMKNNAIILRHSVEFERNLTKLLYEEGKIDTANEMIHNPRLFFDLRSKIGEFHEDIVIQVMLFDSSLLQCQSIRNFIKRSSCNFLNIESESNNIQCKEKYDTYMKTI